jgi:hypothetical protein
MALSYFLLKNKNKELLYKTSGDAFTVYITPFISF